MAIKVSQDMVVTSAAGYLTNADVIIYDPENKNRASGEFVSVQDKIKSADDDIERLKQEDIALHDEISNQENVLIARVQKEVRDNAYDDEALKSAIKLINDSIYTGSISANPTKFANGSSKAITLSSTNLTSPNNTILEADSVTYYKSDGSEFTNGSTISTPTSFYGIIKSGEISYKTAQVSVQDYKTMTYKYGFASSADAVTQTGSKEALSGSNYSCSISGTKLKSTNGATSAYWFLLIPTGMSVPSDGQWKWGANGVCPVTNLGTSVVNGYTVIRSNNKLAANVALDITVG